MKRLIAAATTLVLLSSAASAADLTRTFQDADGSKVPNTLSQNPAKGSSCGDLKDVKCLTLGDAVFHALVSNYADEQTTITGEEKFKRGALALKITRGARSLNFTSEETTLIKRLIGKLFTPLIVAQAYEMLDPALGASGGVGNAGTGPGAGGGSGESLKGQMGGGGGGSIR